MKQVPLQSSSGSDSIWIASELSLLAMTVVGGSKAVSQIRHCEEGHRPDKAIQASSSSLSIFSFVDIF
jgi:hypothetical protein